MTVEIRRITREDWREFRDIRLEMLADTPIAYVETLANAQSYGDDEWIMRAARAAAPGSRSVAAVTSEGKWVGTMSGFVHDARGPLLVSVYVVPGFRGGSTGVADALLDEMVAWARSRANRFTLDVHERNARAIAFYRRRGFIDTGATHPYELPPYGDELEMRLDFGKTISP